MGFSAYEIAPVQQLGKAPAENLVLQQCKLAFEE